MNRHSHWSDQLGQAQRPAFQAGGAIRFTGVTPFRRAPRRACRLKPAFQAVRAVQSEDGRSRPLGVS